MKLRFYILTGSAILFAAIFCVGGSAFAKPQPGSTDIPQGVLMIDTPPPVHHIAEPTMHSIDTSTSSHPVNTEPVNNNPAQTVNPE